MTRWPASPLLPALLFALNVASPLHAQDAQVSTWLAAVQMHRAGVVDDSVRAVLKLPRTQGTATVARAIHLPARPATATLVKALVLHTDAAIAERVTGAGAEAKGRGGPARSFGSSATLLDGESIGNSPRSLQWELARLIAEVLATRPALNLPDGTPDPDRQSGAVPARMWYYASGAVLQQWADGANLRVILDEGLRLFPNDATLLLYRGTLHQTFADGRVQVWIKDGSAAPRGERLPVIPRRVRETDDDLPPPDENGTTIGVNRGTGGGPATRSAMMQIGAPSIELSLAERDLRRALAISLDRGAAMAAGVALVLLASVAGGRIAAQQPSFTAKVDTVRVDVDVRRNNALVSGLSADDFEVFDDGVRQKVELVSASAAPISVVLALDTSASLDAREREHLTTAGARVVDALEPPETAALLTFSERIAIRSLFTADRSALKALIAGPTISGDTALHDAAHAAMLVGATAPGRPIVILFSDGDDTASFLTAANVVETAQRTDVVVCVVMMGGQGTLLQQLATATGGVLVKETSLDRVGARFTEILTSFRRRYLISFSPSGVQKAGWHKLSVKVRGGGDVRARLGYWAGS